MRRKEWMRKMRRMMGRKRRIRRRIKWRMMGSKIRLSRMDKMRIRL